MWARVDDQFSDHPKIRKAIRIVREKTGDPNAKSRCKGVWLDLATYAARHLTDGVVPIDLPTDSDTDGDLIAAAFVSVGILHEVEGGYELHDWMRYNPSAAKVKARREAVKRRVAKHRERQRDMKRVTGSEKRVTDRDQPQAYSEQNRDKSNVSADFHRETKRIGNGVTNGVSNGGCNNESDRSVRTSISETDAKVAVFPRKIEESVTALLTLPPSPKDQDQDQDRQKDQAGNADRGTSEISSQSGKERIARSAALSEGNLIGDQAKTPATEPEVPRATNPRAIPPALAGKSPENPKTQTELLAGSADFEKRVMKALIQTGRAYDAETQKFFLYPSLEESALVIANKLAIDLGIALPGYGTLKALAEKVAGFLTAEWEHGLERGIKRRTR